MIFGVDFFKILKFVLALLELIAKHFGDGDAQRYSKELSDKHINDAA